MPRALWGPQKALKNIQKVKNKNKTKPKIKRTSPRKIFKFFWPFLKRSGLFYNPEHTTLSMFQLSDKDHIGPVPELKLNV